MNVRSFICCFMLAMACVISFDVRVNAQALDNLEDITIDSTEQLEDVSPDVPSDAEASADAFDGTAGNDVVDYSDEVDFQFAFMSAGEVERQGLYAFYSNLWNLLLLIFGFELFRWFESKLEKIMKRVKY